MRENGNPVNGCDGLADGRRVELVVGWHEIEPLVDPDLVAGDRCQYRPGSGPEPCPVSSRQT